MPVVARQPKRTPLGVIPFSDSSRLPGFPPMPKIQSCSHARYMCGRCRRAIAGPVIAAAAVAITLLYFDQAELDPARRSISRDDARALKLLNAGCFTNHGAVFRLHQKAPRPAPQFTCVVSESPESCASISLMEMQANVGITSNPAGEPAPRHIVWRAQQKINAIGRREVGTFDNKAPRAFAHREASV